MVRHVSNVKTTTRTRDILLGMVIMTGYPLYLSYSATIHNWQGQNITLIAHAIARPMPGQDPPVHIYIQVA